MTERDQARRWREEFMCLSREQLAALTGYSASAIYLFEMKETRPYAWKRYKHVCLAVQIMREQKVTIREWRWGA